MDDADAELETERGGERGQGPGGERGQDEAGEPLAHEQGGGQRMPSPWAIAVAVLALLAFGVLIGTTVGKRHRGTPAVVLADSPAASGSAPASPSPSGAVEETSNEAEASGEAEPEEGEEAEEAGGQEAGEEEAAEEGEEAPAEEAAGQEGGAGEAGAGGGSGSGGGKPSSEGSGSQGSGSTLPPVKHVFLIVLGQGSLERLGGPHSAAPYLSGKLRKQGELVSNYFAVAGGELANSIALLSGQGPTPQTDEGCPTYEALAPGTAGSEGQALGSGCVYPVITQTLASELASKGLTWKAYVQGLEDARGAAAKSCAHPVLGEADGSHVPTAADPYVTWRNPFVYFSSIVESPACASDDVGLKQLAKDLKSASSTPTLSYISPDVCDDGTEAPCLPGREGGLRPMDAFLKEVVPEIEHSAAYREGGLIAITFAQAPQSGPEADSSGCCVTVPYPNLEGVAVTTTSTTSSEAKAASSTSAPVVSEATAASSEASATTSATTAAGGSATNGTTSTSSSAAAVTSTSNSTTSSGAAIEGAPTGGGRVGLLLISKFVKPNTTEVTGEYDHYSLLLSIESLFDLEPLGYAASPSLLGFEHSVYTAYE